MEEYIVSHMLGWKLSYATPYDFIQLFIQHVLDGVSSSNGEEKESVAQKALQITELLLICSPPVVTP